MTKKCKKTLKNGKNSKKITKNSKKSLKILFFRKMGGRPFKNREN